MNDVTFKPEEDGGVILCAKCGLPMKNKRVTLSYLGHSVSTEMLCCECCGQVYLPSDHERGKMDEAEQILGDS